MIIVAFAILTGVAVMAILWPLALRPKDAGEKASDIAFFELQIADINRDRAEERLDDQDAENARAEAARRLLRSRSIVEPLATSSRKRRMIAAMGAIVIIPSLTIALYQQLGHFDMSDMPLTARLDAKPDQTDIAGAVARIERHLREHPDDGRGYEVVAPYFLRTGRGEDAIHAYVEAIRLLGPTAARYAALGEARMIVAQGQVSAAAMKDFEAAIELDPENVMARFYIGIDLAQKGDKNKAAEIFSKLIVQAPPDAPYLRAVNAQLGLLRGVVTPPNVDASKRSVVEGASKRSVVEGQDIAAMPENERSRMIQSMVARLAERLGKNGDDVEGWLKLMRAYSVLAATDKARQAYNDARKAMLHDKGALARLEALAKQLNIGG
jgi:cytochrome c-type biogenesis protein CcmH